MLILPSGLKILNFLDLDGGYHFLLSFIFFNKAGSKYHKISSLVVPFLSRDPINCTNSDLNFRVGSVAGVVVVALTWAGFLGGHGGPRLQGQSQG